jgi:3-oxoadipate enol-lactonase
MQARINGVTLYYTLEGPPGAPWLVFSNSLATDHTMWDDEAAHLARRFRLLRFDTRGHGRSGASPAPYALGELAADLTSLMDQVGVTRPIVIGLSLGGMMAMDLALSRPEKLRGIVVCAARGDVPPGFAEMWQERIAIARTQGMAALIGSTLERWFTADVLAAQAPYLASVAAMITATSVEGYAGCAQALLGLDYVRRLAGVKLPALFIAGANDIAAPAAHMRMMSGLVAGARFVELAPAGHLVNLQQPAAFRAALEDFLAAVPA